MSDYPWLQSYPEHLDWDHMIDAQPLYRILNIAVEKYPDRTAIDFFGKTTSYNELKSLVNKLEKGLRSMGIQKGSRVGIMLPNCPQYIIAYFAILRAGATVVNFNPLYSERELTHQIEDSNTETMITLDLKSCYPKLKKLIAVTCLKDVIITSLSDALPFPKSILFPLFKRQEIAPFLKDERHIIWSELLQQEDDEMEAVEVDPLNDIAVLQYTGGTTGTPKGAMLTHANLFANAFQSSYWCSEIEEGKESILAVLPFFHVFAMTAVMNFSLLKGVKMVLLPRFEMTQVLQTLRKKKPTLMPGVPTMFTAISNYPKLKKQDLSSLKYCISGGAPLPLEVKQEFEQKSGCVIAEGYGLTEASPVVCFNPLDGKQKPGSIGLPMPQTIVTLTDLEDPEKPVPLGEKGELCVSGPQVMKGYLDKPKETEAVLHNDHLHTGDIATMDEEGYVYIVDRLKELIIASGYNIYPRHVEEAIYLHEAVLEAAVIGIPDEYRGQSVKAFIACREGAVLTKDELKTFLKDKLAKYEIPTEIEFRETLPKTLIGKIDKKALVNPT